VDTVKPADPPWQTAKADALLELARRLSHELHPARRARAIELASTLDGDLGLDSLGRAELLLRIERELGAALPEQLLISAETLADLLPAVERASAVTGLQPPAARTLRPLDELRSDTPDAARTLLDVLQFHAQAHGDRVHLLLDAGGTPVPLSYAALLEAASVIATGLAQRGLQRGDAVGIMLPTCLEYFHCFFGVLLAGLTPVPLYPPTRISSIEDHLRRQASILGNARARLLLTTVAIERLGQLLGSLVEGLKVTTPEALAADAGRAASPDTARWLASAQPQEVALLQYTSGSTGSPKGVVLTHANLLANVRAMGEAAQVSAADVLVSWLPLYHDMGLIGAWLGSLYYGCRLVVMSPWRFLVRPARWLWAIDQHGGTISAAPNFAYELCASRVSDAEIAGLDLSSWRMALNGAEPVSPSTLRRFTTRFAAHGFHAEAMAPVYGLAECSVGLAFPPAGRGPRIDRIDRELFMRSGRAQPTAADDARALEFVGCGHALPRHEIRVVDEASRELPDRQQGALQFRGPSATSHYANNPAQTAQLCDGDWRKSGDLGYIAAGEVYVTGRFKDLIVRAGRHIHPHEIEDAVGQVEGVRRGCVAVFGGSDARAATERVVIAVETRETDETRRNQLRERVRAVASEVLDAAPDEIVLVAPHSIPKTTSGKIRRAACRSAYEQGELGQGPRSVGWQLLRLVRAGVRARLRHALRGIATGLGSAWAWTCFGLLVVPTWLSVMLLPSFRLRWAATHLGARCLCALTGTRVRLEPGAAQLSAAGVVVANHSSYLDALALAAALSAPVRFVVKLELRRQWLLRIALDRLGVLYVERSELAASLSDARRALALALANTSAAPLLFFPEGTFTRAPGLRPFHAGAFATAAQADLPLMPLVITGTRSMLRDGSWILRPGNISVRVGPLLRAKGHDFSDALELRDTARAFMLQHCGEPDLDA
jgi:1-acyl-sn-glycerol-3-phosphate acyltransferase